MIKTKPNGLKSNAVNSKIGSISGLRSVAKELHLLISAVGFIKLNTNQNSLRT